VSHARLLPPAALDEILQVESLNSPTEPTFFDLLDRLYRARFKGPVLLHFDGGRPTVVEFPQPVQVRLRG
jgi:hypothetical protein